MPNLGYSDDNLIEGLKGNPSLKDLKLPYVYEGTVTNTDDPEERYRSKVNIPMLTGLTETIGWAEPEATGGESFGMNFYPPYVGQRVFVYFLEGDPRRPIYKFPSIQSNERSFLNGVRYIASQHFVIQFDDENERMSIGDKKGNNQIIFDTKNGTLTIKGLRLQLVATVSSIITSLKTVIQGRNVKQTKKDI